MKQDFDNGLSKAEAERLSLLAEECAEVILAISKILRHGYSSIYTTPDGLTNRQSLEHEIGDVMTAVALLLKSGDVNDQAIECAVDWKIENVKKWLHHQDEVINQLAPENFFFTFSLERARQILKDGKLLM